jgi:hypothetical protein
MGPEEIRAAILTLLQDAGTSNLSRAGSHSVLILLRDEEGNKLSAEIVIYEPITLLAVSAIYPLVIPCARRDAIGQYVLRASAYEAEGCFVFDPDAGELAYKVTAPYGVEGVSPLLLNRLIETAMDALGRHLAGLGQVIYAGANPVDALDATLRYSLEEVLERANDLLGPTK